MAFRRLKYYNPGLNSVDPRLDTGWGMDSAKCVVTISPWPTFKELLRNDPAGISNTKMIGLITNYNRNESIQVRTVFDIGNKNPIFIHGKFIGNLTLSSRVMESINLLGSVYETLLEVYKNSAFEKGAESIISAPELTTSYHEDPSKFDFNFGSSPIAGPAISYVEATEVANNKISDGAILMSLSDVRTRLKFGLSFIVFQDESRIHGDVNSSFQKTTFQPLELENSVQAGHQSITNFKILSGVFLENCIITDFRTGIESGTAISVPGDESISIMYSSSKNIKNKLTTKISTDPYAHLNVTSEPVGV